MKPLLVTRIARPKKMMIMIAIAVPALITVISIEGSLVREWIVC